MSTPAIGESVFVKRVGIAGISSESTHKHRHKLIEATSINSSERAMASLSNVGIESVDTLLTESSALIKDDFPTRAVDALRRARAVAIDHVNSSGNVDAAGASGSAARKAALQAVDSDPRAAAALECEQVYI